MKNITKTKKYLSLFLTLCITLSLFTSPQVFADTYDTSIYDKNDVAIINAIFDNNSLLHIGIDVTWSESTPKRVTALYMGSHGIYGNLVVSGLTELTDLNCIENVISSIDASGCAALKSLRCDMNEITSLNVSGCTALEGLKCDYNKLTTLNISGCAKLKEIDCSRNNMVSKNAIIGLSEAPQSMHLEFAPQMVDVVLPKLSSSLGDVKPFLFAQNECSTLSRDFLIKNDGSLWPFDTPVSYFTQDTIENIPAEKMMDGVVAVSEGYNHTCVIKKDGSLWAWSGSSESPPLGDKYGDPSETPVKVMDGVASVSAGMLYTMAIKKDGSLWGWGFNAGAQLGDGTFDTRITPFKIMDGVVSVSAGKGTNSYSTDSDGGIQTMVIKKDGSLWGWGMDNLLGRVGDATYSFALKPIKLMDNVVSVSAGSRYTMAIKKDGSLWAWGLNNDGQLGVKTTQTEENYGNDYRIKPFKVMDNVVFVSAGATHTLAIKTDGSLWGWGNNEKAQLGDDLPIDKGILPTKIMNDVTSVVAAQYDYSLILKPDGTLIELGMETLYSDFTGPYRLADDVMLPKATQITQTTQTTQTTPTLTATPTASKVLVNGSSISFDAYTISGSNYFKLRDLAKVLSGSEKQFEVTWDGTKKAMNLLSGKSYTVTGGELAIGDGKKKTPTLSTAKIYVDGTEVQLTAYTINGSNYFKLRDVMQQFNVGVGWDKASSTITIDSKIGYTP